LPPRIVEWIRDVIETEMRALESLLSTDFAAIESVVFRIIRLKGRVVTTGIGKSGYVAQKFAATLSSTGTPALFVHPSEASHGDLGMITPADCVFALSKSGESAELRDLLSYCRRFSIPIIAITAKADSSAARVATETLQIPDLPEACPHNLSPTTSSVMMLSLCDAIAVATFRVRQFSPDEFKTYHPGGKLGQRLTTVAEVMHSDTNRLPVTHESTRLSDALELMSSGGFGCVGIVNRQSELVGIFTDGDLRRKFFKASTEDPIGKLMNGAPSVLAEDMLVEDVGKLFAERRIPSAFVCRDGIPIGIVHLHDLIQRGFL